MTRPATAQTAGLCRTGGYCDGGWRPITFCHVQQQFKPLRCRPGGYYEGVGRPMKSCHLQQPFKQLGCVATVVTVRMSGVPSPPVTSRKVQTAGLCRTSGYCEGVGRPITSCHVPQQFKPLVCVAPVDTVMVSGVPSPPLTSRNSSNSWALRPRWLR
jgi:hypothetical protein